MNIRALCRHKRQLAAAQADWDNRSPEWPEEVIDDEDDERGDDQT